MEKPREADMILGGKPFYIHYVGMDKKTGEEKLIHPKDASNPARWDGFAEAFGYRRIKPS